MFPEWLVQGVVGNWVSEILIVAGGALVFYLRKNKAHLAGPALYGIAASVLITIGVLDFRTFHLVNEIAGGEHVTPETVQRDLKAWLDTFHMVWRSLEPAPADEFALEVTAPGGAKVVVSQAKSAMRFLGLRSVLRIAPPTVPLLERLDGKQRAELQGQMLIEMTRFRLEFSTAMPQTIDIRKRMPIAASLTDYGFIDAINEVGNAQQVCLEILSIALRKTEDQPSSVRPAGAPAK